MNLSKTTILVQLFALAAAIPAVSFGYAEGPPLGIAGVPGELGTCSACHGGGSGSGNVAVTFPGGLTYAPGVTQHLTLAITDSNARRWGFELTARQSASTSTQAGSFTATDGNTQTACSSTDFSSAIAASTCPASMPLQYIVQTSTGTRPGTAGPATFAFDWTPPSSGAGSISFYVAANAANRDGSPNGDSIYTQHYTLTSQPAASSGPTPTITKVTNGAGYQPSIAPASWVMIQGTNLGASPGRTWTSAEIVNGKLPTQLDNISVTIGGKAASVYYISPTQINVLSPDDTATGMVAVQVTNHGVTSASFSVDLEPVSPALFQWQGTKYAVATRYPDNIDITPAGMYPTLTTTTAKPGDVITLWGAGFGATNPSTPAGQQVTTVGYVLNVPTVTIGGVQAQVIGAALSPGLAGVYQINITVPALADGDQQIVLQAQGAQSPTGVYLPIKN